MSSGETSTTVLTLTLPLCAAASETAAAVTLSGRSTMTMLDARLAPTLGGYRWDIAAE
jgi:hypothetical protein